MSLQIASDRHPGTQHFKELFNYEHLRMPAFRIISAECASLAQQMINELEDGPELSAGLRKLLEAKDCFVRQMVIDSEDKS